MEKKTDKGGKILLYLIGIMMGVGVLIAYMLIDDIGWMHLGLYSVLNSGVSLVGIIVTLVLFWSCILDKHGDRPRQESLFKMLLTALYVLLYCDMLLWMFDTTENLVVMYVLHSAIYFCNYYLIRLYSHYMLEFFKGRSASFETILKFVDWLFVLSSLMLIVNIPTGLYFSFEGSSMVQGPLFLAIYFMPVCAVVVNVIVVFTGREMRLSDRIWFFSYSVLTFTGLLLQSLKYMVSLADMASFLAVLIVYINVYLSRGRRISEQRAQLADATTGIVLAQVQPYFLRNALNTVSRLCKENPERASQLTDMFAAYLQKNLDDIQSSDMSDFSKELEHAKRYLEIEQSYIEDKLNVEFDLETTEFALPTLTLQPLIENAVEHGLLSDGRRATLTVITRRVEGGHLLVIKDNGKGFEADSPEYEGFEELHIGIRNIRYRLETLCNATMKVESCENIGTVVEIMIPSR